MNSIPDTTWKLLLTHFQGDEEAFRAIAWELVEKERRLNHHALADELERILSHANGSPARSRREVVAPLDRLGGTVPKDKERNAQLVELSQPKRELTDLILVLPLRQSIERIIQERRKSDLLRSHGVRPVGKMLFCGPPGCGKSVAAEAIAHELYMPLATVRFDAVVSSYLGETAANLRKVFDFARSRPVVLFFDEFDAIGKHRTALDEHGELKRVVNSFLQLLDSFHADTLTIAATNHQGLLDPALWRRFDEILFFPKPAKDEIENLLCKVFHQIPVSHAVRLSEVARLLDSLSHADVERVAQDAIKQTILQDRKEIDAETLQGAVQRQLGRLEITLNSAVPESTPPPPSPQRKKNR